MVDTAGDPSALESQIRQLDKALDDSRFQMQRTEDVIRSKTPTGPELDASYRGYVSILASRIQTVPGYHRCVTQNNLSGARGFYELSRYHAALELTGVDVQKQSPVTGLPVESNWTVHRPTNLL